MEQIDNKNPEAIYQKAVEYASKDNLVEAHCFFNLAARKGYKEANKERLEIAKLMSDEQIAEAQKLARNFIKQFE